jgi:hypothetical protein
MPEGENLKGLSFLKFLKGHDRVRFCRRDELCVQTPKGVRYQRASL